MRGKLREPLLVPPARRNIPAYAGKTRQTGSIVKTQPEHPRVCGENAWLAEEEKLIAGTSPRMRGKHMPELEFLAKSRNIPAYAGKTHKSAENL